MQNKTSILIAATLGGSFLIPFMSSSINIALPQMADELAIDAISLGWVSTAYILASVIFIVPFGRIADIYGRKKVFAWGVIIFTLTSLVLFFANSAFMLIAFRFIQGMSGAALVSTSVAIITSAYPREERGRALGINVGAVYLSTSMGPFLGGSLTHYFGWRTIFMVPLIVGLLTIAIVVWRIKGDWVDARGEKFDIVGSIIYSIMVIAVVYGFTHITNTFGILMVALGILGILAFLVWETRAASPVFDVNLFRKNKVFMMSCLATFLNYIAAYSSVFLLSLYLQYIKGFNPQDAGLILVIGPIVQTICSPFAGRISDRREPRVVASVGMACTVIALVIFIFLGQDTGMVHIIAGLVMLGLGFAIFVPPNMNAIMGSVAEKQYGVASGATATMRQLGMIFSMGVVMILFSLYIGGVQITPEYYGAFLVSIKTAFIISAILCFLGIFASMIRTKPDVIAK
jgi:EmrB/QacA subfamily drug resistance transporter